MRPAAPPTATLPEWLRVRHERPASLALPMAALAVAATLVLVAAGNLEVRGDFLVCFVAVTTGTAASIGLIAEGKPARRPYLSMSLAFAVGGALDGAISMVLHGLLKRPTGCMTPRMPMALPLQVFAGMAVGMIGGVTLIPPWLSLYSLHRRAPRSRLGSLVYRSERLTFHRFTVGALLMTGAFVVGISRVEGYRPSALGDSGLPEFLDVKLGLAMLLPLISLVWGVALLLLDFALLGVLGTRLGNRLGNGRPVVQRPDSAPAVAYTDERVLDLGLGWDEEALFEPAAGPYREQARERVIVVGDRALSFLAVRRNVAVDLVLLLASLSVIAFSVIDLADRLGR